MYSESVSASCFVMLNTHKGTQIAGHEAWIMTLDPAARGMQGSLLPAVNSDPFQESPYLFHLWHVNWINVGMQTYLQGWLLHPQFLPLFPPYFLSSSLPINLFFPLLFLPLTTFFYTAGPMWSRSDFSFSLWMWLRFLILWQCKQPKDAWIKRPQIELHTKPWALYT